MFTACSLSSFVPGLRYLSPGTVYINSGQAVNTAQPPEVVPRFAQYKRGLILPTCVRPQSPCECVHPLDLTFQY